MMKVIGLRIEKYIDKTVLSDIVYTDAELEKHIICGILSDNRFWKESVILVLGVISK